MADTKPTPNPAICGKRRGQHFQPRVIATVQDIIFGSVPRNVKQNGRKHCKKTYQATNHDESHIRPMGCRLEDNTNDEDAAAGNHSGTSSKPISKVTSNQCTKKGTSRQNGGDQRILVGRQSKGVFLGLTGIESRRLQSGILTDENIHAFDAVDIARVIAEEDATERGKDAHHVGFPCRGSLDALRLVGSCGDCPARHDGKTVGEEQSDLNKRCLGYAERGRV